MFSRFLAAPPLLDRCARAPFFEPSFPPAPPEAASVFRTQLLPAQPWFLALYVSYGSSIYLSLVMLSSRWVQRQRQLYLQQRGGGSKTLSGNSHFPRGSLYNCDAILVKNAVGFLAHEVEHAACDHSDKSLHGVCVKIVSDYIIQDVPFRSHDDLHSDILLSLQASMLKFQIR
ncbi:hypothetical protein EVAR_42457_1 [Eumeta japonica]|uniref:Uncharacterized protein n=1 Tax=Eumeta variegata TaxID=151549 RepID=A0A4C1XY32_EUMVA|nr:hypothetical protein EVAR_42457_1 [Eumeta japonica]